MNAPYSVRVTFFPHISTSKAKYILLLTRIDFLWLKLFALLALESSTLHVCLLLDIEKASRDRVELTVCFSLF
jgi:hypothetical protein